jgi:hypothetical protein
MVTNVGPEIVYLQIKATHQAKKAISPDVLEQFHQQDLRVYDLLVRLRAEQPVAQALLAELLPAVEAKVQRVGPIRLYGRADLRQELITDLFHVARKLPLRRPEFVTRRLMLAAARRLARRLEREWHRQLSEWYGRPDDPSDDLEPEMVQASR